MRARLATLILAAAGLSLGGCAYGGLGLGYGDPYGYDYGYGYGPYGYGSPYGYGYGSPFGYGYGYGAPYGWYDGFYYPGTGYYVYDSSRNRRVMTAAERQHWHDVMARLHGQTGSTTTATTTTSVAPRENWSGFNRRVRNSDSTGTFGHGRWSRDTSMSSSTSSDTTSTTSTTRNWNGHWRSRHDQ